jgi:hypothetical protein
MTVFSAIAKPMRTLSLRDPAPLPQINTTVDAVAYLTKLHLTLGKSIAPLVLGRVWNAHEVPRNPAWPFIVIADVKKEHGGVSITIEAWGRWTPETTALFEAVKQALPASFEHVSTGFQRPGNTSAGAAVASIVFRREFG